MSTRTVTGTVYGLDETPLEGKRVKFNLLQLGAATDLPVFPQQANPDPIFTDSLGEFSIDLWVNADSEIQSIYEVVFHDDTRNQFILPVGGGSIDISDLIINHNPGSSAPQDPIALALKADLDAGNLTVGNESDWRLKLSIENVDNTSDADKPISTDTKAYVDALAADPSGNSSFDPAEWRSDLSLVVGADVQAHSTNLDSVDQDLATTDDVEFNQTKVKSIQESSGSANGVIIKNVTAGTVATFGAGPSTNTSLSGALTLGTDLAVTEGGTGASTASAARANLGVAIGSDVQAHDVILDTIETTITDTDLAVSTSGAVIDHVSDANAAGNQGKQVIRSVTFPTTSDFLSVADHASLNVGTGDFSLFFTARIDSDSGTESIIYKYGGGVGYQVQFVSGALQLIMNDGVEDIFSLATGMDDDKWHVYVILVDRDGNATAYIDNVEQAPVDVTSAALTLDNSGQVQIGVNGASNPLDKGAMASYVGLTKDLMTAAEIEDASFDTTRLKDLSDLSLCVDISNSSKDDIKDRSSNNHTVLSNGTITYNDDRLPVDIARVSEVFVTEESQLDGTLSSDKVYVLDPSLSLSGAVTITVPSTGLSLRSTGAVTASLTCSANNYTMFDGGGTLVVEGISFSVTGTSSRVLGLTAPGGLDILAIRSCAFVACTSVGEVTDYAIILEDTNQFINCTDGLTISGDVIVIDRMNSAITGTSSGGTIFKEGTALSIARRFLMTSCTDSIGTGATLCDFQASNFVADAGFEVILNDISGAGSFFSAIDADDVKCRWRDNNFDPAATESNTYVGSRWELTSEVETVIASPETDVKVLGTTTYSDEFWFSNTTDNASIYDSSRSINAVIQGALSITGTNGHTIQLLVRKWDDSAVGYVDIQTVPGREMSSTGAAASVAVLAYTTIDSPDDRIELWGQNVSSTGNFTLKLNSVLAITERAN